MGAFASAVILAAENVVDLQYFLMEAARRLGAAGGSRTETDELLSNAAALDYALLLASEHGDEEIDASSPVGSSIRTTMTRAATVALDAVERMLRARGGGFEDFIEHHLRPGGVLDVVRALRARDVTAGDELAFRALTLTSDAAERRRR